MIVEDLDKIEKNIQDVPYYLHETTWAYFFSFVTLQAAGLIISYNK